MTNNSDGSRWRALKLSLSFQASEDGCGYSINHHRSTERLTMEKFLAQEISWVPAWLPAYKRARCRLWTRGHEVSRQGGKVDATLYKVVPVSGHGIHAAIAPVMTPARTNRPTGVSKLAKWAGVLKKRKKLHGRLKSSTMSVRYKTKDGSNYLSEQLPTPHLPS